VGAALPAGGTRGGGGLQGPSVRGLVRSVAAPVRPRAGRARGVGAGGLAVASLALVAGLSLVVAVS
jgi:hypothetical protein